MNSIKNGMMLSKKKEKKEKKGSFRNMVKIHFGP